MIRLRYKRYLLNIILAAGLLLLTVCRVSAASASVELTAEPSQIRAGDTFTVTLTVKGTTALGGFEAFLNYDAKVLEFLESNGNITGGDGVLRIADSDPDSRSSIRSYTMDFRALAVGGCEIAVKDKAYVYEEDSGDEMSVSSNRLSVSVEAAESASKDADLSSLVISPGTLNPDFDPAVTEYTAGVPADTAELVISAVPADHASKVEVSGNEELQPGENTVKVLVTAEASNTKEYSILVTRETGDIGGETQEPEEYGMYVWEKDGAVWLSSRLSYRIEDAAKAGAAIPEGYEKATRILFGKQLTVYVPKGDLEAETVLVYADASEKTEGFNAGFYRLDTVAGGLFRYTKGDESQADGTQELPEEPSKEETKVVTVTKTPGYMIGLLAVLAVLCAGMGIALAKVYFDREKE